MNERDFKSMPDEKLIEETCIRTKTCDDYILASIELNERRKKKESLMIRLTIAILFLTVVILWFTVAQFYKPSAVITKPVDITVQSDNTLHNDSINQKKNIIKK